MSLQLLDFRPLKMKLIKEKVVIIFNGVVSVGVLVDLNHQSAKVLVCALTLCFTANVAVDNSIKPTRLNRCCSALKRN